MCVITGGTVRIRHVIATYKLKLSFLKVYPTEDTYIWSKIYTNTNIKQ